MRETEEEVRRRQARHKPVGSIYCPSSSSHHQPHAHSLTCGLCSGNLQAGVRVTLTGILRVEFEPSNMARRRPWQRLRVIFVAEPSSPGQLPKSIPNYEVSVGGAVSMVNKRITAR